MVEVDVDLEKEVQTSYIDYAMSIIVGRALPDVRDGLKPAQRRILYAMYMIKNSHDQPTKKSARIVGEVIGKFHPHGDAAVYETLVRMAQDFSMNYRLVEGQGNMGSVDGDPAAAQRYTEVRLRRIAEEMLEDLEKRSVRFIPNFDNTEEEPVVLPSKIPNLLINGSSGIAVGVATNILPHNLREVCDSICAYLDDRDMSVQELLKYITGPDFPTGGIVFKDNGLIRSYMTGRGSVTIRSRSNIETDKNGASAIIVTEIPYTINKSLLLEKIAGLVKNKMITGISSLRDESGKEGIRIVIELKKGVNAEYVLNILYAHTSLQSTFPVMNIAVMGNRLFTLNLKEFIKMFVGHRIEVIDARTRFDLERASSRLHIVEGIAVAIENIDKVVELIKTSQDSRIAKERLSEKYGLSEKQADAILEMKLRRLTSLEETTLNGEKKVLISKIEGCDKILSDVKYIYEIIKKETLEIKERYGQDRKSSMDENVEMKDIENEDLIEDEESVIILTNSNYLKRLPTSVYRTQTRGGKGVITIEMHDGDYVKGVTSCMTKDYLLIFTDIGKVYWIKAYLVPSAGRYGLGKAAINLIKISNTEKIVHIINTRNFENKFLVFITKKGKIKRVNAKLFSHPRSNGIISMPDIGEDRLSGMCITDGNSELFIATKKGKGLRFKETGVRYTGRKAYGVRGIRLADNDEVIGVVNIEINSKIVTITRKGYGKATSISSYRLQNRGGKGVLNLKINEKVGEAVKVLSCMKEDVILLINSKGITIEFKVSSIRTTGRNSSGVKVISLDKGIFVVDAQML